MRSDYMPYTHVVCLENIDDEEGVYCTTGNIYAILGKNGDTYLIECEFDESDINSHPYNAIRIRGCDGRFSFKTL